MFRKKDVLLIGLVLLMAAGIFLFQFLSAKNTHAAGFVRIWVDGSVYREIPLGKAQDIAILQENGCENILHLTENGFFMQSANCSNQLCIGQGEVNGDNYPLRSLGTHVLCLPNRVDVELVLENVAPAPDAPDI